MKDTSRSSGGSSNRSTTAVALMSAVVTACVAYYYYYSDYNNQQKKKEIQATSSSPSKEESQQVCSSRNNTEEKNENGGICIKEINVCCQQKQQDDAGTTTTTTDCGCHPDDDNHKILKRVLHSNMITITYASTTGTCKKLAEQLEQSLRNALAEKKNVSIQIAPSNEFDWWDELLNEEEDETNDDVMLEASSKNNSKVTSTTGPIVIFILPTWTGGTLPTNHQGLLTALEEIKSDWRVAKRPLDGTSLRVAVFGMGSSAYDPETFCKPAKSVYSSLLQLGSKPLLFRPLKSLTLGDDEVGDAFAIFHVWMNQITSFLKSGGKQRKQRQQQKQQQQRLAQIAEQKEILPSEDSSDDDDDDDDEPDVMDMEDLGNAMVSSSEEEKKSAEPKEMVTPKQAKSLKKEGYKIIGTHSAVKLCRWTKHQLRGRGGCYKHTFYGITSYQCMEATPSLACANKCVFCWRHHKNPVGREWRWKTDDPHFIVDQAVKEHINMIKEAKGIPGVKMDRWTEAHTVRHCALSLVGEPIMYPRIDEFLEDLHDRKISTFLVTNGQHPKAITSLRPITQLYVSVDAPTQESLIEIDRPLFRDAWDRLKESLVGLKDKGQRTVARLTVVKGWNSDEIEGYAKLVALGHCSLVEVKGVTFCGKSDASNLNMSNTPWHHEVVALTQTLQKELLKLRNAQINNSTNDPVDLIPEYGLACEHKHSCSVLLARADQFSFIDEQTGQRRWKTWIDYDKFHELAQKNAKDPTFTFSVEDYVAPTPTWALFGATEEGFDPTDTRHYRAKKHPKYTKFDDEGIPTHHHDGQVLTEEERSELRGLMEMKKEEIRRIDGSCNDSIVTESQDGTKTIEDPSLMFRGLVVSK